MSRLECASAQSQQSPHYPHSKRLCRSLAVTPVRPAKAQAGLYIRAAHLEPSSSCRTESRQQRRACASMQSSICLRRPNIIAKTLDSLHKIFDGVGGPLFLLTDNYATVRTVSQKSASTHMVAKAQSSPPFRLNADSEIQG